MSTDLKIKVCGMRDPDNIKELILYQPDYMGFIFYPPSKRYVEDPGLDLFRLIPAGISKVGVYVNETTGKIKQMVTDLNLDLVQLHGDETPEDCKDLMDSGIHVMKAFRISDSINNEVLKDYEDWCEYFLFDTSGPGYGGIGEQFDWGALGDYRLSKPFFLSGGIGPEDVSAISGLDLPVMAGVDINSRFEKEPGLKDMSKVSVFIQSIRRKQQ